MDITHDNRSEIMRNMLADKENKLFVSVRALESIREFMDKLEKASHEDKVKIIGYDTDFTYYSEIMAELISRKHRENMRVKRSVRGCVNAESL